ncbi:hypothetical protein ACIPZF_00430 [Pseudomonas sp. NPDC089752]|uniref:hypothetical protein n=1 Tax=Pseudomonas sp. NPDC089752 TaxID=3364472 RepID=UPI00382BF589
MATTAEVKALLAKKYGKKVEDLEDSTLIKEIVGNASKLPAYLKEAFDVDLSISELEGASDISDLVNLL